MERKKYIEVTYRYCVDYDKLAGLNDIKEALRQQPMYAIGGAGNNGWYRAELVGKGKIRKAPAHVRAIHC